MVLTPVMYDRIYSDLRYTYDFLVEGDSLHVIVKNVTDLSQLSYSLSFQCPVNCTGQCWSFSIRKNIENLVLINKYQLKNF